MARKSTSVRYWPRPSPLLRQIPRIRAHVAAGGVIAYPTESCYGLGCDPRNHRAVKKILSIKGRPQRKGMILVAASFDQLQHYVAPVTSQGRAQLDAHWPGPFTFVMDKARGTPRWLTGRFNSLAVRVTAHPDTSRLCKALGMALVSTSANRAGMKPLKTYGQCLKAFGDRVLVLPGRAGRRKRPSTIMDLHGGHILRK
jgi:L-threonylcarbamoyladenylate synthase